MRFHKVLPMQYLELSQVERLQRIRSCRERWTIIVILQLEKESLEYQLAMLKHASAHFPGTFCTNNLDLTNVLKEKDSNLASFVGKWWMYVAHARYLLIGNFLVWSITMLHVELDRQLSSSWINLQTIACSCFHRSVDISKKFFHNFQSLLATVCSNQ